VFAGLVRLLAFIRSVRLVSGAVFAGRVVGA
jgi:hypothetical protein